MFRVMCAVCEGIRARAPVVCRARAARLSVVARVSPPAAEPPEARHSEENPAV